MTDGYSRSQIEQMRAQIEAASSVMTDEEALESAWMCEKWKPGTAYEPGKRLEHDGHLFRVRQAHTSAEHWIPEDAPALYERIAPPEQTGGEDAPIEYRTGMALENGKIYLEDGIAYTCFRDTGIPIYNRLADLVGIYVNKNTPQ